jgi:hypothetical protein
LLTFAIISPHQDVTIDEPTRKSNVKTKSERENLVGTGRESLMPTSSSSEDRNCKPGPDLKGNEYSKPRLS